MTAREMFDKAGWKYDEEYSSQGNWIRYTDKKDSDYELTFCTTDGKSVFAYDWCEREGGVELDLATLEACIQQIKELSK